jgi:hypothetical protein
MKIHQVIPVIGICAIAGWKCSPQEPTSLSIKNAKDTASTVYVSFGSDSKITAKDWSFCTGSDLSCSFSLDGKTSKALPATGYLNATFAFDNPVGCGITKAEVNINNPKWYDILDVSLVDGYSDRIQINATPSGGSATQLGPPVGKDGNEEIFGVFPYGCDICVERQNPPCDIPKGKEGCKKGTQYNPDVPCQWQGTVMGGGNLAVEIELAK